MTSLSNPFPATFTNTRQEAPPPFCTLDAFALESFSSPNSSKCEGSADGSFSLSRQLTPVTVRRLPPSFTATERASQRLDNFAADNWSFASQSPLLHRINLLSLLCPSTATCTLSVCRRNSSVSVLLLRLPQPKNRRSGGRARKRERKKAARSRRAHTDRDCYSRRRLVCFKEGRRRGNTNAEGPTALAAGGGCCTTVALPALAPT
jgi:hypothetical protein